VTGERDRRSERAWRAREGRRKKSTSQLREKERERASERERERDLPAVCINMLYTPEAGAVAASALAPSPRCSTSRKMRNAAGGSTISRNFMEDHGDRRKTAGGALAVRNRDIVLRDAIAASRAELRCVLRPANP